MNLNDKVALSSQYSSLGYSNAKIARLLRVDASSVSRYLKQAEDDGWVERAIKLCLPAEMSEALRGLTRCAEIEEELWSFFSESGGAVDRSGVVVVRVQGALDSPDRSDAVFESDLLEAMGMEGGRLLVDLLTQRDRTKPTVLGITWGRSTGRAVDSLARMGLPELPDLEVVPLQGGVGRGAKSKADSEFFPDILAERLSTCFHSEKAPSLITLPAYISGATADLVGESGMKAIWTFIEGDRSFCAASAAYSRLDIGLIGIGGLEPGAWAVGSGYLRGEEEATLLRQAGACGDIACRFFRDREEDAIEGWQELAGSAELIRRTNQRAIGIPLGTLRARVQAGARVIAIAGGKNSSKASALRAAALNGFISDFVTDEMTARQILSGQALG